MNTKKKKKNPKGYLFVMIQKEKETHKHCEVNWPVGILTTAPLLQCWAWTQKHKLRYLVQWAFKITAHLCAAADLVT